MSTHTWKSTPVSGRTQGALLVLGCVVACCGCGEMKVQSIWRQSAIVPDGSAADWGSDLFYVENLHADFGVVNDDSTLYLCVILRDRRIERQLAASGMQVWFEPQGSHAAPTGVGFPLGNPVHAGGTPRGSVQGEGMPAGARPARGAGRGDEPPERGERRSSFRTDAVQILGESTLGPLPVNEVPGLRVAIDHSPSRAVIYELAMPLTRSVEHPYAIGAHPGDVVLVRFEIPAPSRPEGEMHGPGGPDDGSMGGGGVGGPGGHGGMGGPGGPGARSGRPGLASEPWQAKVAVTLALPS
jgi:hypothetical protein